VEQLTLSPFQQMIIRHLLQCGGQAAELQLIGEFRRWRSRKELGRIIASLARCGLVEVEQRSVKVTDRLDRRTKKIIQGKVGPIVHELNVNVRSRR
jgi:hypothetical protein